MLTIDPKETPIPLLHKHLLGAIGPRPIAFASTVDENGVPNLSPFSFFNCFGANPPILIFSPARSGRTGNTKDTYNNVKKIPEVVINTVNYDIIQQVSLASCPFQPEVNEFQKSGLTPIPSDLVRPFRVKESHVQMECKVLEVRETGTGGAAGNLIICEVIKMHINEDVLGEDGLIDQHKIDLVSRMGGNWYCHSNSASMFEIPKPITTIGIGYDAIPEDIRLSTILSGNDLGKLGGIEALPDETEVNDYKLLELADIFISFNENPKDLEIELHKLAKNLLEKNNIEDAWKTLLAFNNQ
ncbi:MAG: flavin reductase family protein [Brumimicrobium sp.]|nr:flavin reductase family protein [Brumimicrobium sp.]